jgi:hypothetical protein
VRMIRRRCQWHANQSEVVFSELNKERHDPSPRCSAPVQFLAVVSLCKIPTWILTY